MRIVILSVALALSACTTLPTVPAAPVEVADKTTLDEQAAFAVELAYKAARTAAEIGVDAGLIKGERAARFRVLNDKAYRAVLAVRAAYQAGNATDYAAALASARASVAELLTLTGKE